MKRELVVAAAIPCLAIANATAALAQQASASAVLHQVDGSAIMAEGLYLDSGAPSDILVVSGEAVGLDPAGVYISLLYDARSKPAGPLACEPSPDSTLTEEQMFVGVWTVNPDGTGTLFAVKTDASYVPLRDVGTMSVREGPEFGVVACGEIRP